MYEKNTICNLVILKAECDDESENMKELGGFYMMF